MTFSFGPLDEEELEIIQKLRDPKTSKIDKKGILVETVLSRITIRTLRDTGEMRYYDTEDGIFKEGGKEKVLTLLEDLGGFEITNALCMEVIESIRRRTFTERANFDKEMNLVHCGNGWVNPDTRVFIENSPVKLSLKKLAAKYDPAADCPNIKRFLNEVLEEEDLEIAKKLLGYILLPDNRYKKAFMPIGPKDAGKTTFLALLEAFVGRASHVSLHDLASRNHNVVTIAYSMLNTTSEVPQYALKDVSLFKNITGNDEITVRAIYQPPFDMRASSKFVLAANDPPNFADADNTFIDRWVVLEFNNVFEGDQIDVDILRKLTTPEELSGMLNMALDGLAKLKEDGYFESVSYEERERRWQERVSKIADYLNERTEKQDGTKVESQKLYANYLSFCEEKNIRDPLKSGPFGKAMKRAGYKHDQGREGRRRPYFYFGLTIKGEQEKDDSGNLDNFGSIS